MSSGKAEAIANLAIEELQKLGITLDKLRGQGFDGASVMSGVYLGVQTILKNKTTNPVPFVHCSTHNLCLVIKDVVAATNHTMVTSLTAWVFTFDGASLLRWEELKMNSPGMDLKKLCPTRWSSRHEAFGPSRIGSPTLLDF